MSEWVSDFGVFDGIRRGKMAKRERGGWVVGGGWWLVMNLKHEMKCKLMHDAGDSIWSSHGGLMAAFGFDDLPFDAGLKVRGIIQVRSSLKILHREVPTKYIPTYLPTYLSTAEHTYVSLNAAQNATELQRMQCSIHLVFPSSYFVYMTITLPPDEDHGCLGIS